MRVHRYVKRLFPALREGRWVSRHREQGHAVVHYGQPERPSAEHTGRCYWYCSCYERYWC